VERDCTAIQEELVEVRGDVDHLGLEVFRHIEHCPSCRAVAEAERGLDEILIAAVPPADPEVTHRVMESLAPNRRRRLAAFVPVAASMLLALLGVAMVGGVPGGSLAGQLPALSSQAWLAIANAAGGWSVGVTTAADAVRMTLSPAVQLTCLLVSLLVLAGLWAAARRWQPLAPWRRSD
jgi:anti-sigma factor RsiW